MSLQDAIKYGQYGWSVFPLLPRSKSPACPSGFHDASKDEAAIRALWSNKTNLNLGIATGDISGFFVLDIDLDKGGVESLGALENKYGSLPETLVSKTGGGGKHYLFKIPANTKIPCSIGKIAKGIDTRGNGGYIAAPPSVHPNGHIYEWGEGEIADAPAWLIRLILALKSEVPKVGAVQQIIGDWTTDDVLSMLDCVSPESRDTWIQVGMALNEGGWPVTMWDTWSRSSPKYKMGEPFRIWAGFKSGGGISFGTLVHMAQESGWIPKDRPLEKLDFSNVGGVDLSEFQKKMCTPIGVQEKTAPIEIGGLIGDTLSWINSTSKRLQPELAIMHTIATLGAVFGRRYALQMENTRTNIYMVAIAESGQGKDNSRNCLPLLLKHAGLDQFYGPETVKSSQGLLKELKMQPSFIANIDEFGLYMAAISDPRAPTYFRTVSDLFTSIFGKSGGVYKDGITASNPDDRIVLNEPNLCIYGTTTLDSYAEAMRKSTINSGKINRFIVFKTPIDFPERNKMSCWSDPPESLVSRWSQFKTEGLEAAPDIIEQKKTLVLIGETKAELEALGVFQDEMQKQYHPSGMGPLWVRYRENVLKIAMVVAIARDHKSPALIMSDLEFAKTIVKSSIMFMLSFAQDNMYDSEFQKRCSEFMKAASAGVDSRAKMNRILRIKPRELDEIENAMKETGQIGFDEKIRPRQYILKIGS